VGIYRVITICKRWCSDNAYPFSKVLFSRSPLVKRVVYRKKTTKKCDERSVLLCSTERRNAWSVITVTGLPFLDVQKLYRSVVLAFFHFRKKTNGFSIVFMLHFVAEKKWITFKKTIDAYYWSKTIESYFLNHTLNRFYILFMFDCVSGKHPVLCRPDRWAKNSNS